MRYPRLGNLLWPAIIAVQLGCIDSALAERVEPNDWLNRMGVAVQVTSYEGTVIRIQDGKAVADFTDHGRAVHGNLVEADLCRLLPVHRRIGSDTQSFAVGRQGIPGNQK